MHCSKFGWNWLSGSWEEDVYFFANVFSLFCNYLPLKKGGALDLNKFPFKQGCFVPNLVEIGPVVLKKKMEMWKVYDDDDKDDEQRTNFDLKSTLEPVAYVR